MPYLKPKQQSQPVQNKPRNDIGSSLNEIGNTFGDIRQNMPHIVIGGNKIGTDKPNRNQVPEIKPYSPNPYAHNSGLQAPYDNKYVNYAFYIVIALVIGYAAYRLLMMFISG